MTEAQFFRREFTFEREFGQHRNWWVRDPRIAGNPLSIYLFLLSHDPEHMPTQSEAMRQLGIGRSAWSAAKEKLLRAGFLLEIRDRYPAGAVSRQGEPCGGQKRFRLELLDPEPGVELELDEVVIELDRPLEEYKKAPDQSHCTKRALDESSQCTKHALDEPGHCTKHALDEPGHCTKRVVAAKPLISSSARNVQSGAATARNVQSFIGREKDRKEWIINPSIPSVPSEPDAGARNPEPPVDAGVVDEQLGAIDPRLSRAALEVEVAGRVDLAGIDLVTACTEILAAHRQPEGLRWPPAYVAKSLVANPERWKAGQRPLPPAPKQTARDAERAGRDACLRGEHDWGPASWPALDRAHCIRSHCLQARRDVDSQFAALENAQFEGSL